MFIVGGGASTSACDFRGFFAQDVDFKGAPDAGLFIIGQREDTSSENDERSCAI